MGEPQLHAQGATQSNHARQTVAAAAAVGMECYILLERRVDGDELYETSGNVLLDVIMGGHIVDGLPGGTDMNAAMEDLAEKLRSEGKKPYVIPGGGSNTVGALPAQVRRRGAADGRARRLGARPPRPGHRPGQGR